MANETYSSVSRIGIRAPHDYNEDASSAYAVNNDEMFATVTECSDGIGYIVETWHIDVGLTTYFRANTLSEAVAFADGVVA